MTKKWRLKKIDPREIPGYIKSGYSSFMREIAQMRGTNIWVFIMYGLLFDMVNNLWRPFSVKFLERLGGTEFEISLLSALPGAVAAIVLLPGAILFRRFTNKKRATAAFILISRSVLLLIAFVPMLPPHLRPLMFVVFVAIMNCPDSLSQTSLQSLLGTVFNGGTRGQAIALRTKFGQAIIPVVTVTAGLIITFVPNTDEQRMVLYQIFFVGAFLLGIVEVTIFNRLKVPEEQHNDESSGKGGVAPLNIMAVIKDKRFLRFCIPAVLFAFTWQAGWPLGSIFQVKTLQATELWFAIFALVSGLTAFFSGAFWQKLLRKHGNNVTFVVSAIFVAGNMFVFPFVPNVQVMAIASMLGGFSAIGINTSLLNGVLEATPDENRMIYLAVYNTAMNVSLFIAPFFAHFTLSRIGLVNAMMIVGVMRIFGAILLWASKRKMFLQADS